MLVLKLIHVCEKGAPGTIDQHSGCVISKFQSPNVTFPHPLCKMSMALKKWSIIHSHLEYGLLNIQSPEKLVLPVFCRQWLKSCVAVVSFYTVRLRVNMIVILFTLLIQNVWIVVTIWLKFVLKGSISKYSTLVHIVAWHWTVASHYLNQWRPSSLMHHPW